QGGSDLGLFEINEAAQLVSNSAAVDANIIFGAVIDDALGDEVRVTVIAAGLDQERAGHGSADGGSSFRASASASHGAASLGTSAGPAPASPPRPAPSAPASHATPQTGPATFEVGETGDNASPAVGHGSNGSAPAVPDASFASAAGSILSAPVPGDGFTASSDLAARVTTPAYETPEPEPARPESSKSPGQPERVAVTSDAGDSASYRPAHAEAGKTFDVATTRRRPVVFEEDDDLDVPDFLK
ncbi:MAG: cell division protein FtsZ, partial [Streptosporangiaceae bacterium]